MSSYPYCCNVIVAPESDGQKASVVVLRAAGVAHFGIAHQSSAEGNCASLAKRN